MAQLRKVTDGLRTRFPRAATVLEEAAEDVLAYRHLPLEHQRQLHSPNPLERLNKEIKRGSHVVGIFPNPAAVIRLVGALLLEQDDEWAVAERRYFSAESMKLPTTAAGRRSERQRAPAVRDARRSHVPDRRGWTGRVLQRHHSRADARARVEGVVGVRGSRDRAGRFRPPRARVVRARWGGPACAAGRRPAPASSHSNSRRPISQRPRETEIIVTIACNSLCGHPTHSTTVEARTS